MSINWKKIVQERYGNNWSTTGMWFWPMLTRSVSKRKSLRMTRNTKEPESFKLTLRWTICVNTNQKSSQLDGAEQVLLYSLLLQSLKVLAKVFKFVQTPKIKTVAAFLFALYENHSFPDPEIEEEIIWSDGPSSEFKNTFTMKLLHQLSVLFQKQFFIFSN